jgi:hypothetical protein
MLFWGCTSDSPEEKKKSFQTKKESEQPFKRVGGDGGELPALDCDVIHFDYGVTAMNSGCTIQNIGSGGPYTYTGVYGPIAQPQEDGYLVRGYGKPIHAQYYNSLILKAKNSKGTMATH